MTNKKANLTVNDILKRSLFKDTQVIAGHKGLTRPVVWAHVLELLKGYSFINGGELILSTASGYGDNKKERIIFLTEIIKRDAAGLCIELGTSINKIPNDMKELADTYNFPLIIFKKPVHFVNITMDLHETIMHTYTYRMREFEQYSFEVQQLALENRGIFNITQSFNNFTNMQAFFIDLDDSSIFIPNVSDNYKKEFMNSFKSFDSNNINYQQNEPQSFTFYNKKVLYQPIIAKGNTLSFIGTIINPEENIDRFLYLSLNYTAISMAQILLREMFAEERFLDNQQKLLNSIIDEETKDEDEIKRLLGMNTHKSSLPTYFTIVMQIKTKNENKQQHSDSSFHDLIGIFRSALDRHSWDIFISSKGYIIYFLFIKTTNVKNKEVHKERKKAVTKLEAICDNSRLSGFNIQIGVGRESQQYSEMAYHFEEAEQAINSSPQNKVVYFENLGVQRLFLQNSNFGVEQATLPRGVR